MNKITIPDKDYWQKRSEKRISNWFKEAERLEKRLKREYEKALQEIQKEISYFYAKYAVKENIQYKNAILKLNKSELRQFRYKLENYIKEIQVYKNKQLEKELNALSVRSRITRLESLEANIKAELSKLHSEKQLEIGQFLSAATKENYYQSVYEVFQGIGVGGSFSNISPRAIETILKYPWSGENFSDRIWGNAERLARAIKQELTQAFIQGKSNQKLARSIRDRMNVSYKNSIRLVRTETAYIANESTALGYEATGIVNEYEYISTLDSRTSDTCSKLDGKVFKLSERQVGVNYPPSHPNCRSTTVVHFEDEIGERIARDLKGKSYYVPSDMTYEEWYQKHVVDKYGKDQIDILERQRKNRTNDKQQYKKYKKILGKKIPTSFDKFQELKYNNSKEWNKLKEEYHKGFITKDFKEIAPLFKGKLGDVETRKWYKWHDENIPNLIDKSKPIEDQAREAHSLRNTYRTQARDLMRDQEKRKSLDLNYPNKTFEELIADKMKRKNMTREQAIQDILKTATKSNKKVNKSLGLE